MKKYLLLLLAIMFVVSLCAFATVPTEYSSAKLQTVGNYEAPKLSVILTTNNSAKTEIVITAKPTIVIGNKVKAERTQIGNENLFPDVNNEYSFTTAPRRYWCSLELKTV